MQTGQGADAPARKARFGGLYLQVLTAILIGGALGYYEPAWGVAMQPLSLAFVKLVRMIIGPVIFLTVVSGVAGMADLGRLGGVTIRTLLYFFVVSTLALLVGLAVANIVQPGAGMNINPATLDTHAIAAFTSAAHDQTVVGFLLNIIPNTFVGAFAEGDILQVLLVSVLFGIAAAMAGERAAPLLGVLDAISAAFFNVVHIVMRAAPIGAFGAFAFTIGKYGIGSIVHLAALIGVFYGTSAAFILIVLGAIAAANGFSILRLLAYLRNELLLVFGTSSSEAALPSLIEKLERAGVRKSIVGLVVPTGYSFNLDGTNIYMTLAALFIAQATGVHMTLGQQLLLLSVAMISSKGAAGVTGAGFITLAATLAVVPTVPVAGMVLILGVDRFMSECRALTNFVGNAVAAIVVGRWENAIDAGAFRETLGGRAGASPAKGRIVGVAVAVAALAVGCAAAGALIIGPDRLAQETNTLAQMGDSWIAALKH